MALANTTRVVSISADNTHLNLPITTGIDSNGYWFYYLPKAANNALYGANVNPYRWSNQLDTTNVSANTLTMEGTIALISETWEGNTVNYHGSSIEHIGSGINDITAVSETDAFFFSHLGSLSPAPDVGIVIITANEATDGILQYNNMLS